MKAAFHKQFETWLYTMNIHLLCHIAENVQQFVNLDVLNSSQLEQYNFQIKNVYWATSQKWRERLQKTAWMINNSQIWTMKSWEKTDGVPSQFTVTWMGWNKL